MDDFLSYNYVVTALSARNEATLVRSHNFIHYTTKAIAEDFGNEFVADIAQGNKSKVSDMLGFVHFGDEDKIGVINLSDHGWVTFKISKLPLW